MGNKKSGFVVAFVLVVQVVIAVCCLQGESIAGTTKIEDTLARLVVVEFKDGSKGSGVLVKETPDAVYLADPDGSMETSFSRDKIVEVRKPTIEEMERLKEAITQDAEASVKAPSDGE